MPSVRQIAEEAGVSIATVSRVLNRNPQVSEHLREKVQAVVQKRQAAGNGQAEPGHGHRDGLLQAQQMQGRMQEMQAKLEATEVEGAAGAGMVKATATAKGELKALSIDPAIFTAEDREVVEDLIVAAVRDAQEKGRERNREEIEKITQGLGLPPGFKLPF